MVQLVCWPTWIWKSILLCCRWKDIACGLNRWWAKAYRVPNQANPSCKCQQCRKQTCTNGGNWPDLVLQQRKQPQQMGLLTQILCCGLLMTWSWVEMVSTRIMAERCLKVQKDDLSDFARWTLASSGTFTFFWVFSSSGKKCIGYMLISFRLSCSRAGVSQIFNLRKSSSDCSQ